MYEMVWDIGSIDVVMDEKGNFAIETDKDYIFLIQQNAVEMARNILKAAKNATLEG